ncbi:MAG: 30S ribosome-binding factor RbfA [Chloroflexota bacterium]|jgi:ribosome-binding factor A|nr:30S ribosome-binding factor RbfA [Anaerolineae bacterium]HMM27088.1 30S ribosome-binding factor RbfA [Aggregatilineaceae bacterium]
MTIKQQRVATLIRNILSTLLMTEVTDPALESVTVTDVKIDREFEYADVYVYALDDQAEVMAGLARANGYLRRELAQRVRLRNVPVLHFHWDVAMERGERIDSLLQSLDLPPEPAPETPEDDE